MTKDKKNKVTESVKTLKSNFSTNSGTEEKNKNLGQGLDELQQQAQEYLAG
jgi:hypothetical protein